ncbi:glycosidase [Nonlabens spongiae]|uniref:Glycosidase n=1 Tax=Nonlabens spongiae TaxID=331648 RepID=A0A1W6MGF7_9FLAO|nr:glycoside hydrolase family 2 TIM barrel-domain containing protein [Nonlabens spongiae]ARN76596.1 glycosidase [Nonlabens spongiae]
MKKFFTLIIFLITALVVGQANRVVINEDSDGFRLKVDGVDFMINGMNWDYVPIGTNYSYSLWEQPDDLIKAALDSEMGLLKNMGVNTIRVYAGMQPKWITYIYENYGIYTMLNDSFGRYGLTINGVWYANTEYSDPRVEKYLMKVAEDMVNDYKDTPGLLMYMLGNENNYGLSWGGAETEDIPIDSESSTIRRRARAMYKLMNNAVLKMKSLDANHPIAICNGDLLYLDLVKEEAPDIDIYATNMYRGVSFGDAFSRVKEELGKPIMFSEFGADAFNAIELQEDQYSQAYYMFGNWKEIYMNSAGLGLSGNSIGGFTFQFSDGWWKRGQTEDLFIHNTEASWSSGGYSRDLAPGENNMNEEWFGICAKGPTNARGLYTLYPRAAYYALKNVHNINPYGDNASAVTVLEDLNDIQIMDAVLRARGDKALATGGSASGTGIKLSTLRAEFDLIQTGGSLITTPDDPVPNNDTFPDELGFDHMQSYYVGVEGKPASNVRLEVTANIIGRVAENPINEIFYENRGRQVRALDENNGVQVFDDINRLNIYQGEFDWNAKDFDIRGFYRTGHYHWGYEGDFFNLYPEANYGPNLDIYGGETFGFEFDGKKSLDGLKIAVGPQLWWGANPTMLFKYSRDFSGWNVTGIYHRDFEQDIEINDDGSRFIDPERARSGIIPPWPIERATLAVERSLGELTFMVGGIWGGSPLNGIGYQDILETEAGDVVVVDRIKSSDNWGAKGKIMYQGGRFNSYVQGSYMGLVANGGADQTQTFTGWRLKDSGSGNMTNLLAGFTYSVGQFQVAPNFMYQKPLVDPIPNNVNAPGRLRNFIDDPFAVREGSRETTAGELLITFDPTPGTWMYDWDNDRKEDAKFAASLGFVYRYLPTTMDGHIGFQANRTFLKFAQSVPAQDLYEANLRMVSKLTPEWGIIGNFYYGNGQANGDSERVINRFGADLRMIYKKIKVSSHVKINDWGPYDYHRDFNLTFPTQLMLDVSTTLGKPDWYILPDTQIGIRGLWRSLNEFSPRYAPNETTDFSNTPIVSPIGFPNGSEWEIRTYIHFNIGN